MTASQAYLDWVKAGEPWRLARPIEELKALFHAHGVPFLGDLGNAEHLQNSVPKDHTPFPANPWPIPLPARPGGYIVCACDHANGPWADALLADAKAGWAPFIKYLNFGGHHYDVRNHWLPEDSSDEHLHISIRSDWTDRSIGAYSPFGDDDMALDPLQAAELGNAEHYLQALAHLTDTVEGGISNTVTSSKPAVPFVAAFKKLAADLAAVRADVAELRNQPPGSLTEAQLAGLTDLLATHLPHLTAADVQAALREVLATARIDVTPASG